MKASEIRIGIHIIDVFNPNNPIERQIDFDDLAMLGNYKNHPLPFKPIPITEEWLLKFGFIKNTYPNLHWFKYVDNGDKIAFTQHKEYGSNKHLSFYFNCGGLNNYSSVDLQLIYVHQLQNLYFALTNEELTLKQN